MITDDELKRRVQAAYEAGVRDGRDERATERLLQLTEEITAGQGQKLSALVIRFPERPE